MKKRLNKFRLESSVGLFGLLVLFCADNSCATSSFKNTPLYKHLIRARNAKSVRLYEKTASESDKQEDVVGEPGDEQVKTDNKHAGQVRGADAAKSGRIPQPPRKPDNLMDPSTFTPDMPFSEAINILRNSTSPGLNIVVLWKDLEENADIYPDTPIGIDGVTGVSLNRHLRSLVDGVSGGAPERLGYVVEDGVIVISTLGSLPRKLVTRVYDITDLVGWPSNYGLPGFGLGMGMQGGAIPMQGGMTPASGGGYNTARNNFMPSGR